LDQRQRVLSLERAIHAERRALHGDGRLAKKRLFHLVEPGGGGGRTAEDLAEIRCGSPRCRPRSEFAAGG